MSNWIGIAVWIVIGIVTGSVVKGVISRPEVAPGHGAVLLVLAVFGALIGGMLGVGIFHFHDPISLSAGGMAGAVVLSTFMAFLYRWGVRTMV